MTIRQKLLRTIYPFFLRVSSLFGRHRRVLHNEAGATPAASLYDLSVPLATGETLPLARFRGRKLLLVNTASDCIYTSQYEELQALQAQFGDAIAIIAFPSNDFKEQEKGSDSAIAEFCRTAFGLSFPIAHKAPVRPGAGQQPVYRWLTDRAQNGWNSQPPSWNFSKYLVDEEGRLTHYFDPAVSPTGASLLDAVKGG
ncbi:MAG: glutathione peroxidase [Chitinophagaceae bacterium]|nr:MAG: glutathione peroxidase [Chitinophagaceae bacterium]